MKQIKNDTPVRVQDTGAGDSWSVFAENVVGNVEVQVSPKEAGPFVTALTITEDGAHVTGLSRQYFVKIDPANADEVWVV